MGSLPAMVDTYGENTDRLIPVGVAATMLNVSVKTLRRWEAAGKISAIRTPGGQRRFREADISAIRGADR